MRYIVFNLIKIKIQYKIIPVQFSQTIGIIILTTHCVFASLWSVFLFSCAML